MLKLRVETLPFQPKLEDFQIDCGFKTSWGISLFFSNIMTLIVHMDLVFLNLHFSRL